MTRSGSSSSIAAVVPAKPATLEDVARDVQALKTLFHQHLDHHEADEQRAKTRHEATMSILQDLLVRVP